MSQLKGPLTTVTNEIDIVDDPDQAQIPHHESQISLQTLESMSERSIANIGDLNDNDNNKDSIDKVCKQDLDAETAMMDTIPHSKKCNSQDWDKKVGIGTIGIIFIIFGISILASFISFIHNEYNNKCLNLNVDLMQLKESRANYSSTLDPRLINNPEMIFYDSFCKHKVVNIFNKYPCNCRILALESSTKSAFWFNQHDLESILLRFDNLEGLAIVFDRSSNDFSSRLNGTFHLTNEMLMNHKHLTTLTFSDLSFEYINGLEQLEKLEMLSLKNSFAKNVYFPFEAIGTLENLKVLELNQVPYANNTYIDNSICNLKHLMYFEMDFMQHVSQIPFDCIAKEFDNLFYFSMAYMLLIEDIDVQFWNMNSMQSIFFDFSNSLKQSNFDFDTFNGYSSKLEKVSIQAPNDICQSYTNSYQNIIIDQQEYIGFGYLYDNLTKINNNNIQLVPYNNSYRYSSTFDYGYNNNSSTLYDLSFVSESDSSGLLKFIKQFNPCLAPCDTGISFYECTTKRHGDGVCDDVCNNAGCGFDGGDCDQLCNLYTNTTCYKYFDINNNNSNSTSEIIAIAENSDTNATCTLNNWQLDGVCNIGCNNSCCHYDFNDCVYTPTTNDTCNNNAFDDTENENGNANITCYTDWAVDLWCDSYCEQLLCENPSSGCGSTADPCRAGTNCHSVHATIINLLAAIYQPYELITLNEVCEYFQLLALVTETNTDNLNCSQAFDTADLNNNGYIGLWEAIVYTAEFWGLYGALHWQDKIEQIDCSACLENASLYWW